MNSSSIVRYYLYKIMLAGLVTLVVLWAATPIVISVLYAFTSASDYYNPHILIPLHYTLSHIEMIISLGAGKAILNSIIVALITIVLSFTLGLPAGYAFARYMFTGKSALQLFILGLRMFPVMVIAIPLVSLYMRLGLDDTLLGVALAHTVMALPFVILITSSIFAGVPRELEEAALVFGLDGKRAFLKITMPLALPGLAAAAMYTFMLSWNEVFIAAILTLTNRTLPAFMLSSAIYAAPDFFKFAGGFIMILPAMIFVFIARKYLIAMWSISLR